jgi:hypothetical protein
MYYKGFLTESSQKGWIGFDLDATLAIYNGWKGYKHIGEPIQPIVDIVKQYLKNGHTCKIFTARVDDGKMAVEIIQNWLVEKCGLPRLEVTNIKDKMCIKIYDDRAIQVEPNTGKIIGK